MEPQILSLLGEHIVEECEDRAVNPFESLLSDATEKESEMFAQRVWKEATGKSIDLDTRDAVSAPLVSEFVAVHPLGVTST